MTSLVELQIIDEDVPFLVIVLEQFEYGLRRLVRDPHKLTRCVARWRIERRMREKCVELFGCRVHGCVAIDMGVVGCR